MSKDTDAEKLKKIFDNLEYAVFGMLLPTEEEAAQRQQGQGLKILTPKQMITRLPILLAQLKAGNNSDKLKNEIRQIVYSLYRSKDLSKTIENNLINTI